MNLKFQGLYWRSRASIRLTKRPSTHKDSGTAIRIRVGTVDTHSPSSGTGPNPLSLCSCLNVLSLTADLRGFWPSRDVQVFWIVRRQEEWGAKWFSFKTFVFCLRGKYWSSSRKITCWKIKLLVIQKIITTDACNNLGEQPSTYLAWKKPNQGREHALSDSIYMKHWKANSRSSKQTSTEGQGSCTLSLVLV